MRRVYLWLGLSLLVMLAASGCMSLGSMLTGIMPVQVTSASDTAGDALRGQEIYQVGTNGAPGCIGCHALTPGGYGLGPSFAGLPARAASRREGMSAEQYIHQSIVEPRIYVTPGFRDSMYADYAAHLSEQDISDLTAYLLSIP